MGVVTVVEQRAHRALRPDEVPVGWGDRVLPEAPDFRPWQHTAKAAAAQVGYGIDLLGIIPTSSTKALWVAAHGHGRGGLPLTSVTDPLEATRISMASHGLSVVSLRRRRRSGEWTLVGPAGSTYNRRVHGGTTCKLTGPAARDPRLRTAADPSGRHVRGTFGHSVGTITPWGSVMWGEGRFMDYFETSVPVERALERSFERYGLVGPGRGWAAVDPRFDVGLHPAEAFRFGWVGAVDPRRPTSRPRKLTMLGRLAHALIAASVTDDGRAMVRLRDGLPGGHDYVYVSRGVVDHGPGPVSGRSNMKLLASGTLYVVPPQPDRRPVDEQTSWVPLVSDGTSYVPGMSASGVLLDTRLATQRLLGSR